jgi:hypothetical protein
MRKALVSLAVLILAVPGLASATSHFTVKNQSNQKVTLSIYDGDDSSCIFDAKGESVDSGATKSFTCTGGGKQRCKVAVSVPEYDSDEACEQIATGCGTVALVVIPDGETLTVEINYDYCSLSK